MATTTPNLGLVKPDYEDLADIAVINDNMDIIDTSVPTIQTGITSITPPAANTVVETQVTFPQSFSTKPKVFCTCDTSDPRKVMAAVKGITTSGFTISSWREYTGSYNVLWFAVL